MATFTDKELEYLKSQRLARLATADSNNAPHVVPVGFRLAEDGTAIDVGGGNLAKSKKYRDLQANPKVASVIERRRGHAQTEGDRPPPTVGRTFPFCTYCAELVATFFWSKADGAHPCT